MANSITYLLGAGASYNALPIVSNWNKRLEEFIQFLKLDKYSIVQDKLPDGHKDKILDKDIDEILQDINTFFPEAIKHATIDTYAKNLFLKGEEGDDKKLKGLKHFLGCFFAFEQKMYTNWDSLKPLDSEIPITSRKAEFEGQQSFLDERYNVFFAKLLDKNTKCLDERINIISWNYDLQIELAYKDFYEKEHPHEKLKVFPSTYFKINELLPPRPTPKVIKLNGTAGLFHDPMNRPNGPDAYNSKGYQSSHINFNVPNLKDLLILYSKYLKGRATSEEPLIHFAWEIDQENKAPESTLSYSKAIIENTNVLVVIGYSFPDFNRSIDKIILQQLNTGCKIYYQDCKEKVNGLIQRLNGLLPAGKNFPPIVPYTDVDQFFIPYEL